MHSLRSSVLFCILAIFAFLVDSSCVQNSHLQPGEELVLALAADQDLAPLMQLAQKEPSAKRQVNKITRVVRATAYNAVPQQTDSTPTICAWGDDIRPGVIAISRDLERVGLTRGKEVHIEGYGKRVVLDRMNRRKRNQIDLYMERYEDAMEFGVKKLKITWHEEPSAEQES